MERIQFKRKVTRTAHSFVISVPKAYVDNKLVDTDKELLCTLEEVPEEKSKKKK